MQNSMPKSLKIAVDYDGTISEAPLMFSYIIDLMVDMGHDVRIVTMRSPGILMNTDVENFAEEVGVPVIYTGLRAKRDFFDADIWIEDNPGCAHLDYTDYCNMLREGTLK